jgi:hypothetical protein
MDRKRLLAAAVGALVAAAIAGGIAYATIPGPGNVYSACMLKGVGTIRLIDKSLPSTNLMSHCTDKEIEISWNQAGQPGPAGPSGPAGPAGAKGDPGAPGTNGSNGADGKDGVGVTTASEPAGTNCADGGVQVAAANGVSYVCNGKAGADGTNGTNGTNGADGKDGANGINGADGKDGVSVTSAVEQAGGNCANGGSKFTAVNGVTYACNGTSGGGGLAGRELVTATNVPTPADTPSFVTASCPSGKVVIGGGFAAPSTVNVFVSSPTNAFPPLAKERRGVSVSRLPLLSVRL